MTDDATPNRGGRPKGSTTSTTKLRTLRMGSLWDRAEELALEQARRDGKVLRRTNRETGEVREFGNVSAYVEEALRRENARVGKLLDREVVPNPNHACAAHDDAHLGQPCPDRTAP